jgi:hypothetical protein
MSDLITQKNSEYNQTSFLGGMNLLGDDSRLQPNQYRIGYDVTNRYDVLDPVLASVQDTTVPTGLIQELTTFGNYVICFVSGFAYYRLYSDVVWTQINDFKMSITAPRFWSCPAPVALTNYVRFAATASSSPVTTAASPNGPINLVNVAGAAAGNLPGLLVQDNINQPQFIFINSQGIPSCRVTQNLDQWMISFTDATNTVVAPNGDNREYVPIGNCMAWVNGILYLVSQDTNNLLRSVSGRPLDFVVNVVNTLATNTQPQSVQYPDGNQVDIPAFTQIPGGGALTTAYSVGVGNISCIRALSTGGLFVAAGNANFAVTLNQTPGAPTLFGEYTFNRAYLFEATCLSDRAIIDTLGDTRFIDLTGVRSFNAVEQVQNEGRNTPFTANIQGIFGSDTNPIVQSSTSACALLFNNYEHYAVNTIFGYAILKYDTLNSCWTSVDVQQVPGVGVKILAKIELGVRRMFAVTTDNKLFTLYIGPNTTSPSFRSIGVCSNILYVNQNIKMNNPKYEGKLALVRGIINNISQNGTVSFVPYVNNRLTLQALQTKEFTYEEPKYPNGIPNQLPDVDTNLYNFLFTTDDCGMGWKVFGTFSWSTGSLTQFSYTIVESTPSNPPLSQETVI